MLFMHTVSFRCSDRLSQTVSYYFSSILKVCLFFSHIYDVSCCPVMFDSLQDYRQHVLMVLEVKMISSEHDVCFQTSLTLGMWELRLFPFLQRVR